VNERQSHIILTRRRGTVSDRVTSSYDDSHHPTDVSDRVTSSYDDSHHPTDVSDRVTSSLPETERQESHNILTRRRGTVSERETESHHPLPGVISLAGGGGG
jgi:hypothetical protein